MDDNDDDDDDDVGLVVGIIDFPVGGTFGIDGQNIILKQNDHNIGSRTTNLIGVKNIPRNYKFHLVTCNSNGGGHGSTDTKENNNTINTAITVGFIVWGDHYYNDDDHVIRKYDPQTEEVSSNPVDEITRRNLLTQMPMMKPPRNNIFRYDQIVHPSSSSSSSSQLQLQVLNQGMIWKEQTRYINESSDLLLREKRGLFSGRKIVPGCYDPKKEETEKEDEAIRSNSNSNSCNYNSQKNSTSIEDGTSIVYPPIPVIDRNVALATHMKHNGTRLFLSRLAPSERTKLLLLQQSSSSSSDNNNDCMWLDRILMDYYSNSWSALLGDLQLSYLVFLYLGCYASLEHWKDLLAMLSLEIVVHNEDSNNNTNKEEEHQRKHRDLLYLGLLRLLPYQLSSMVDPEFLEDIDGEGDGNFLLPSLMRLLNYYERKYTSNNDDDDLLSKFRHVLSSKFPRTFSTVVSSSGSNFSSSSKMMVTKIERPSKEDNHKSYVRIHNSDNFNDDKMHTDRMDDDDAEDNDDDGPVVISSDEIEASLARSSSLFPDSTKTVGKPTSSLIGGLRSNGRKLAEPLQKDYPLLTAAIMPHEDVLMTCARALDEKRDVSLVREAAAYLEKVEQYQ